MTRFRNFHERPYRIYTSDGILEIPAATVHSDGSITPGLLDIADPELARLLENVKGLQRLPEGESRIKRIEDEILNIKQRLNIP